MLVEGSVAVVTGGASGLGAGTARMLAGHGGRVVLVDRDTDRGQALAADLGPDHARFVTTDVTRTEDVARAVQTAIDAFGRLDVAVNCAGISPAALIVDADREIHPLDTFRQVLDVNLVGAFDVVRQAARAMSHNEPSPEGERGLIVNTSSIAGLEGQIGQAGYTASKGALAALTLQLARDLARWGVRVMSIAPGVMDTPMVANVGERRRAKLIDINVFPKRLGTPEDFANLVRTFMETTFLNGEIVRLDAAVRLNPR